MLKDVRVKLYIHPEFVFPLFRIIKQFDNTPEIESSAILSSQMGGVLFSETFKPEWVGIDVDVNDYLKIKFYYEEANRS